MEPSLRRRNSMDFWADFDVFISVFEESRSKMEDAVSELKTLGRDMDLEDGVERRLTGRSADDLLSFLSLLVLQLRSVAEDCLSYVRGLVQKLRRVVDKRLVVVMVLVCGLFWSRRGSQDELMMVSVSGVSLWFFWICLKRIRRLVKLRKVQKLLLELMEMLRALNLDDVETSLKKQSKDLDLDRARGQVQTLDVLNRARTKVKYMEVLVKTWIDRQPTLSSILQRRLKYNQRKLLQQVTLQSEESLMRMEELRKELVFIKESNSDNI